MKDQYVKSRLPYPPHHVAVQMESGYPRLFWRLVRLYVKVLCVSVVTIVVAALLLRVMGE